MAIHVVRGQGAPAVPPTQLGEHYVDIVNRQQYLAVGTDRVEDWLLVASNVTFLQLTDTPNNYAGAAGYWVEVNKLGTGLEFQPPVFLGLLDTPKSYTGQAGRIVAVNNQGTGLEFANISTGGAGIASIPESNRIYVDAAFGSDIAGPPLRGQIQEPFKTIEAAVSYVASLTPSASNRFQIVIQSGTYTVVNPIQIPQYTGLFCSEVLKATIVPTVQDAPTLRMAQFTNLQGLQILAPTASAAVHYPDVSSSTLADCLIYGNPTGGGVNDIGIDIQGTTTEAIELFANTVNIGQLGSLGTCVRISGGRIVFTNFYCTSSGSQVFSISGAAYVTINIGSIWNSKTCFICQGSRLLVADFACIDIEKVIDIQGASTTLISDSIFRAVPSSPTTLTAILGSDGGSLNQIVGCSFRNFNRCIESLDLARFFIRSCAFEIPDAANSVAIFADDDSEIELTGCTFISLDNANGPIALDFNGFSFNDIYNTKFYNFASCILAKDNSTSRVTDCGFEVFEASTGSSTGIIASEEGWVYLTDVYMQVDKGARVQDDGFISLTNVSFEYCDIDFEQFGNGEIFAAASQFNEDQITVQNWAKVSGDFHSTKTGDRALVAIEQLKVGVPELGSSSAFGEGSAYTRGMLVYTYNPTGNVFTDVSISAREAGGANFGIPNTIPNSAIYIASSLRDALGNPVKFNAIWNHFTVPLVAGSGQLLCEIFTPSGWQRIDVFQSRGTPPYNQMAPIAILAGDVVNIRLSDKTYNIWALSDPVGFGTNLYWMRFRVASDWINDAWNYRLPLEIPAAVVSGIHQNFVVHVPLSRITDTTFWDNVNVDGSDIRVTDATGVNLIPQELVWINRTAKTGGFYFKAPSLSNAAVSRFYIYFGNAAATPVGASEANGRFNCWSEYLAVFHFGAAGISSANVQDSTRNAVHGTITGTINAISALPNQGSGIATAGANADAVVLPNSADLKPTTVYTMECIFQTNSTAIRRAVCYPNNTAGQTDYFGITLRNGAIGAGNLSVAYNDALVQGGPANSNTPVFAMASIDTVTRQRLRLYQNGVQRVDQVTTTPILNSNFPINIANNHFKDATVWAAAPSWIDEVRLAKVFRDLPFAVTQYNNQSNATTFLSPLAVQTRAGASGSAQPITQAPQWDQIKLYPNCAVIHADGFIEYFGTARAYSLVRGIYPLFDYSTGADNAPAGGDVFVSKGLATKSSHRFADGVSSRMSCAFPFGNDADSSAAMKVRFHFVPRGGVAGNVYWRVVSAATDNASQLYTDQTSAPQDAAFYTESYAISIIDSASIDKMQEVLLDVTLPSKGAGQGYNPDTDMLWVSLERLGGAGLDTYTGNADVVSFNVYKLVWRQGQFIGSFGV